MAKLHPVAREIAVLGRAGYPLIAIVTHEERRAMKLVRAAAAAAKRKVVRWTAASGFGDDVVDNDHDPMEVCHRIARDEEASFFVLIDFQPYLNDPVLVRRLREAIEVCPSRRQSVILIGPDLNIPTDFATDVAMIDLPLPNVHELSEVLASISLAEKVTVDESVRERAVRSALGLSSGQAERVFRKVMVLRRGLGEDDLGLVVEEKKGILRNTDVLEFYELSAGLGDVGGLGELKRWLADRTAAFGEDAVKFGLPPPKGLLLLGVQGCGKSLSAKAVAQLWKFPLLRLDVGAIFGSASGSPEAAVRSAIKIAESLAPVVLWVDEIEKGFASTSDADQSASRVFGSFITWLSEKTAHVFVVATANDVTALPPELLRRGRFDEVFFVDLPNPHERLDILAIHLKKRKRNPADFARLAGIAQAADGFSGAELEQVVIAGLYTAFSENRELSEADLTRAIEETVPLYRTYEEKIKALRDWSRGRARPATLDTSVLDMFGVGEG